jgi:hypothetical protein
MTVYKWSATAANNDDIDSTINWQEGQSPASVNNSARAMMAAIAKWRYDMSGLLGTAGTSTAYTLTTTQVYASLVSSYAVAFNPHVTNGAAATLNVDGLGAKALATVYGTAVGAGKLRAGGVYVAVYNSVDDKWIVQGNPNDGFEAGTKCLFRQTAAPTGWTKDTTYTDSALRVTSGTISQQAVGGREFSTLFTARTITQSMLPNVTLSYSGTTSSNGSHTHGYTLNTRLGTASMNHNADTTPAASGSGSDVQTGALTINADGAHTHTYSGNTSSINGNVGQDTIQFGVNFVDVIIATRD